LYFGAAAPVGADRRAAREWCDGAPGGRALPQTIPCRSPKASGDWSHVWRLIGRLALGGAALVLAGCATPGPNHLYMLNPESPGVISDHATTGIETNDVPSFLADDETLLGLAYEPFTDHLFLRLAPGNRFRVVDRPDRSIKREFTASDVPDTGGGDLAIRSRDRHLFLSHPTNATLIELTLHGRPVRTIPLQHRTAPPGGIAYDQVHDLIYATAPDGRGLQVYDREGRLQRTIALPFVILPPVLAYDSAAREFYVQRPDHRLVVLDADGNLQRELADPQPDRPAAFDVGPRSFLRIF